LLNFNVENIIFSTFASIKKLNAKFDFIIIDEIHKLSKNNIENLQFNYLKCPTLGLTGTLTNKTANTIYDSLTIPVCYKYSINKAVEEGILTPYKIYIHKVPLDDKKQYLKQYKYSRHLYTEKELFTILQKSITDGEDIIKNIKTDQKLVSKITKDNFFMYLKSINIIQNSVAKILETKRLLDIFSKDRVLVFCGTTNTTDQLDIPVYHSKAKEKKVFEDFAEGKTQYLATIDMLKAGIKFLPLDKGIINYISGQPEEAAQTICRFLAKEINRPDKEAEIHVICIDHFFETSRMETALTWFSKDRITYVP
jgi:superfamily II DNA or RNA helicase